MLTIYMNLRSGRTIPYKMRCRAKRAGTPVAAGEALRQAVLLEQTRSSRLNVDAARTTELFHGFHLRAGDVHIEAAIHDALGQQQIRIGSNECTGDFALIQRAQQLLGSDDSSVNIGETLKHNS